MSDDGTINLRGGDNGDGGDDAEFKIGHVEGAPESAGGGREQVFGKIEAVRIDDEEEVGLRPYSKVKVKFDKFVNLVASHAYEEVFERHIDEDIIVSTDLLTDLANAHEEKSDRKMPVIFLVGIVLGVGLTWLLLRT